MQRPEEELLRSSKMTVPLICLQKQMVKYIFESEKSFPTFPITATGYPQVDGTVTAPIRYVIC